jgi:phosphate-selective porin OprO/OprP
MNHFRSPTLAALFAPLLALGSAPLLTSADGDASPAVDAHLKALDQEIQELKRQLGAAKGVAPAPTPSPEGVQAPLALVRANSRDGFLIESADGSNRLRIGGYIDFDYRDFADDERALSAWGTGAANTFYIRHARPELTGTVADIFDFRLLAEFAPTQSANTSGYTQAPVLLDAYVATRIDPGFVVTVGQFKSPIGLEYLQYTPYNEFVEIGLASQLVPGRDEGVQLSGKVAAGTIFYQVGVFNGGVDGGANIYNDVNSGKDGEGRIILTPFARAGIDWLADLNVGISGSYGKENGTGAAAAPAAAVTTTGLPSFKTTSQLTFFTYNQTAFANGAHIRYSPQAYWSIGSLWTLDEYVVSKQRVGGVGAIDSYVTNKAYQVEVGYVLTGEKASYNGVIPASEVNKGGWGAWELVARVNHLAIGEEAFDHGAAGDANITKSAREATALAAGVNWYLNRNIKILLDYEHTEFKGGGGGTVAAPVDRNNENLIVSRLQLLY